MSHIKTLPWQESLALKPLFDRSPFAEGTYGWFQTLAQTTLDKNEDAIVVAIADESGTIKSALPLAVNKAGSLRALTAPYTTRYSPPLTDVRWSRQLGSAAPSYVRNILRLDALDIADPGMAAFLEGLEIIPAGKRAVFAFRQLARSHCRIRLLLVCSTRQIEIDR